MDSYQIWADMLGDQSYTFDALLPYFQEENFTAANPTLRPSEC